MSYIWNNPDWPSYSYDAEEVEKHYDAYLLQKKATDIVFGILDPDMRNRIHARSLTDEILSSLEIEGEKFPMTLCIPQFASGLIFIWRERPRPTNTLKMYQHLFSMQQET